MKNPENVYRQFVQFEERAASIYLQFASRFSQDPEISAFWLDMGMQEKQHAGLLQFCLCEQLFAPDLPGSSKTEELAVFFEGIEKQAADPNLTIQQAFKLAIEMETSEINSIYCNLTTVVHNSIYLLRRKIATSLPDHIDELVQAARRFGVDENALRKLTGAKEECADRWRLPN